MAILFFLLHCFNDCALLFVLSGLGVLGFGFCSTLCFIVLFAHMGFRDEVCLHDAFFVLKYVFHVLMYDYATKKPSLPHLF